MKKKHLVLPWTRDAFVQEMTTNLHAYYISCRKSQVGKLLGFVGCGSIMDESHITNVAVAEQVKGQGIGEGLMREAIRVAQDNGVVLCLWRYELVIRLLKIYIVN